jgi:predicted dehydrogenase
MSLGIGIIGLGWIAQKVYLPYLSKNNNVKKLVVYDIDKGKLLEAQAIFNVAISDTLQSLLNDAEIDAVFIASPNYMHFEQIIDSLNFGKKVFCEKPICINKNEIGLLQQAVIEYPNQFFPLLPNRHREELLFIKSLIESNSIGHIYKVKAHWLRSKGIPGSAWFLDSKKSGGGVLIDLGSHLLDILYWLSNPDQINQIVSHQSSFFLNSDRFAAWHNNGNEYINADVEDDISAFLLFDKMSWSINLSWAGHIGEDETCIQIFGEKGKIDFKGLFGFSDNVQKETSVVKVRRDKTYDEHLFDFSDRIAPYYSMLEECIKVICGETQMSHRAKNALDTLSLIDLIYSSGK